MDIELPSEIWREILSYNSLPICRRVCRLLYYIEENLTEDRINNISTRYESSLSRCLEAEDWDASILVMNTYNQMNTKIDEDDLIELPRRGARHILPHFRMITTPYRRIEMIAIIGEKINPIAVPDILKKDFVRMDENTGTLLLHLSFTHALGASLIAVYINDLKILGEILHEHPTVENEPILTLANFLGRKDIVTFITNRNKSTCILS